MASCRWSRIAHGLRFTTTNRRTLWAVIHTRYENGAVGKVKMDPPMSFIHVKGPAYNYWGRVLAGKLHRLPQAKLTKGLEWKTQSVLLVHRFAGKGEPKTLLHYNQRLRQPLKVTVLSKK